MTLDRAFLIAPTASLLIADPTAESREITDDDLPGLAQLFIDAYAGSVDDEGQSLDDARAAIGALLQGAHGQPRREAWLGVFEDEGPLLAAMLCTTWKGMPFVAHLLTQPSCRERGHATSLIRQFAQQVDATGGTAIGMMVTRANPATHLLDELGFQELFSPS
ncbi:MAG: GNAT family N-acetyltransferase [Microbacteriaceae bacterium]